MKSVLIGAVSVVLLGAAGPQGVNLQPPSTTFALVEPTTPAAPAAPAGRFAPAPIPNRDYEAPRDVSGKDPRKAQLAPTLIGRRDQYHGEAITAQSSSQASEERRLRPGAGLNLTMPLR